MNFRSIKTNIFAFLFLIFAGVISAESQIEAGIFQLQSGTVMRARMDNEINSKVASVNDTFTATLAASVTVRESVILPIGTVIEGRVTKVKRASFGGKSGNLEVLFQMLRLAGGEKRPIEGVLTGELRADDSPAINALTIIGGTSVGGIVGAISKGGSGALIGSGIGAGVGISAALFRKGKNVKIKTDQEFEIKLLKNVTLPVLDY